MLNEQQWEQEQERLEQVKAKLQAKLIELEPQVDGLRDQAADIRKRFWEEISVNTSTDEDFEETFYSIKQQDALLSERERSHRLLMRQWNNVQKLLLSPYFGRIDFHEDGTDSSEQIYIGVSSFIDDDNLTFLIYDWRTPIASMYYDYSPGRAAYETPEGKIDGTVELKRQYQISRGQLQHVFDTSITIGDELLQQVLGKGANNQMQSIVATIQKEQNAIIRDDSSHMLIVQGAAGSGKTSAALQRVAYLLYKHREKLKADQIVLFSPNPMFNSYVSSVLPELGEENMQQTTFQEYLEHWLGRKLRLEDPFDQIEYVLTEQGTTGYEARLKGIQYKASTSFLHALHNYAQWLGEQGMCFNGIWLQERELITAEQMKTQFYSYDSAIRLTNRIELLQEWLMKQLSLLERKEQDAAWIEDELHYLDKEEYAAAFKALHRERGVFDFAEQYEAVQEKLLNKSRLDEGDFDFADREEAILRRSVVKKHFKPLRRMVKQMRFVDLHGLYMQLFSQQAAYQAMTKEADMPQMWSEICEQTQQKLSQQELFYEDTMPYLYLKELIEGVQTSTTVRHVFIDEGQDYSIFQYEFLKKLFPRARMTILGDFQQAIFTQATELDNANSPLQQLYDPAETRLIQLVRSYRSTYEIVQFTKGLLSDGTQIVPFERRGKKPLLVNASDEQQLVRQIVDDVAALQAEGLSSIAIVTKTAWESSYVHGLLLKQELPGLRLITKQTLTFEKGTTIIPVYLAKGVEFDAVLVYDASKQAYRQESERKLFYTACTRAMHRLVLYKTETAGAWTPFIEQVDPAIYEVKR